MGTRDDSTLLLDTDTDKNPTDPYNPYDWTVRSADYMILLKKYLGSAGKNVEQLATEFNSAALRPPGSRRPAW